LGSAIHSIQITGAGCHSWVNNNIQYTLPSPVLYLAASALEQRKMYCIVWFQLRHRVVEEIAQNILYFAKYFFLFGEFSYREKYEIS
jgi:hypothetical protein